MADNSIVQGLFGIDPNLYQLKQNEMQDAQAQQFAQMSGAQQGQYGLYRGGQLAGQAVAGLMGGQDPVLAKATDLKRIVSQFPTDTPQGLRQAAQALIENGHPEQAQMAIAAAQKMEESAATIHSKMKEQLSPVAKAQADRMRLLQAGYSPNSPEVQELTKYISAEGSSRTPNISVDAKMFDFGAGRRDSFLKEVSPIITQGAAINQGLTLIAQGTPFGQSALENTISTAFGGDKQKSRAEMKNLMNTGNLSTRVQNSIGKFLDGKITPETTEDQKNVLEALQGNLKRTYNAKRDTILKASSGVPELRGQDDFIAPPWEATVTGSGAARGQKAFTVGETFNVKDVGPVKVLEVDASGKPTKVQDSKGNVGTPK